MNNKWYAPCLRGVIGDWVYYSTLMRAEEIASRIIPVKEIRETKALDDYLQRDLKKRVTKIASYLRKRDDRFFSSIIVGVFEGLPDWVELDFSSVKKNLKIPNIKKIEESIGLLIFDGSEKMFAIDGQHRIEGIKLAAKSIPERFEDDEYSILLVAHRDDKEGKIRTRRLFCDINKNMVRVSEGDSVVIDEDLLTAIVTRRVYANYPYFKKGEEIAVSEKKEQLIQNNVEKFTSILSLHTACKCLKKLYKVKKGSLESSPENVKAFKEIVTHFLDYIINNETSLNKYFILKDTTIQNERKNNKNLFFRPVGLEILARLYTHFALIDKLLILKFGIKNIEFTNPGGIFDGIIWNSGKIDSKSKPKTAAVELCLYLLNQLDIKKVDKLLVNLKDITKNDEYSLPNKLKLPKIKK